MPEGGEILPFNNESDFATTNPCSDRNHYIAYYENGNVITRAIVAHEYRENLLTSTVEIVYLFSQSAQFASEWTGNYERMDHIPCFP